MNSKKVLTSTIVATAVAGGTYFFGKEENREKVMHNVERLKAKLKNETKEDQAPYFKEKVGHSDPHDIEDNAMVDEGAVYSVKYYNEHIQQ
ncbi:hypothetical protein LGQ02_14270 [Bacillus shivajii]|uniref:hypothetical protein n=1 Tax=Bacillus shivajii TaxID=1983719 RepID=UPI001CFB83D3|nr:hypothetical protein [Bacillus shivajii]UCZ52011.1 hypothetical protein LGQ02_14270 [Bacillus shivajii]